MGLPEKVKPSSTSTTTTTSAVPGSQTQAQAAPAPASVAAPHSLASIGMSRDQEKGTEKEKDS